MKNILLFLALLLATSAGAAPFVKTDPIAAGVTQCGFYTDAGAAVVLAPVAGICQLDVATIAVGAHVVQVDQRTTNDPIWGTQTSPKSVSLNFTRPGAPPAPTNPVLSP